MSATATKKGSAATSETIEEVFHEAMRSYERNSWILSPRP